MPTLVFNDFPQKELPSFSITQLLEPLGYEHGTITDIGGSKLSQTLRPLLDEKLLRRNGQRQCLLPSPLLSDDAGLTLWHEINRLPDYYQTCDEVDLLNQHGVEIASMIEPNTSIIDLGCGDIRKVLPLLSQLYSAQKTIRYFALDLSRPVLEQCMSTLRKEFPNLECYGLWGTFQDCLTWADQVSSPKWLLSLGSILGNDFPAPAIEHLSRWRSVMGLSDRILLGMDANMDMEKVWKSYHDTQGLFEQFMRNGLVHTNRVFGYEWYRHEDWDLLGVWSEEYFMHRFVYKAKRRVICEPIGLDFPEGHEIDCYEAFKFGPASMLNQFNAAGLEQIKLWKSPTSDIYEYLLVPFDM